MGSSSFRMHQSTLHFFSWYPVTAKVGPIHPPLPRRISAEWPWDSATRRKNSARERRPPPLKQKRDHRNLYVYTISMKEPEDVRRCLLLSLPIYLKTRRTGLFETKKRRCQHRETDMMSECQGSLFIISSPHGQDINACAGDNYRTIALKLYCFKIPFS